MAATLRHMIRNMRRHRLSIVRDDERTALFCERKQIFVARAERWRVSVADAKQDNGRARAQQTGFNVSAHATPATRADR